MTYVKRNGRKQGENYGLGLVGFPIRTPSVTTLAVPL